MTPTPLHHLDKQAMRAIEGVLVPRSTVSRFEKAGEARRSPPAAARPDGRGEAGQ